MIVLGLGITAVNLAILLFEFLRKRRQNFPAYGWAGLIVLVAAEILMLRGIEPIAMYFTPLAWSAYILVADGAVLAVRGRSRLHDAPGELVRTAMLSVPLWLIFEAYNLRLANWTYVGLPAETIVLWSGYAWAFATITPGIFETADLIEAFDWFAPARPRALSRAAELSIALVGAACLIVPLVLPKPVAAYLFGLVWVGFVFLLDPINKRLGLPSLLGDLAAGRHQQVLVVDDFGLGLRMALGVLELLGLGQVALHFSHHAAFENL
ncbi:MAG TPA: hypothetical protein VF011_16975 [Terriglobales bacterium]